MPTVSAGGTHIGVAEASAVPISVHGDRFLISCNCGHEFAGELATPCPACGRIQSGSATALSEPFMIPFYGERPGQDPRTHSVDEPVPTIPASGDGKFAVVESFLLGQQSGATARPVSEPCPAIATKGAIAKVDPFVIPLNHGGADTRTHDIGEPMPTVTTIDAWALIEPFLVQFYGSGSGKEPRSTEEPLPTVTVKDRFGLVRPVVEVDGQKFTLDIRFRMLTPRELARAMSFDEDYQFVGNRENQVKQIGNAVPCETAKALCTAALKSIVDARSRTSSRQSITGVAAAV